MVRATDFRTSRVDLEHDTMYVLGSKNSDGVFFLHEYKGKPLYTSGASAEAARKNAVRDFWVGPGEPDIKVYSLKLARDPIKN